MANRQVESRKVKGLALQSNSFSVPEGSFEKLDNCTIVQDNIIKKKRGSSLFVDNGATNILRNLGEYQDKLLGFCGSKVQVYNQNASGDYTTTTDLSGVSFTIAADTKSRSVKSNGNMYFTADQGVFKLESATGNVLNSGIDPATDLQIFILEKSASETFFRPDSQISYRVLFGRKDANNNTVIGAPSQIVSASNPVIDAAATLAATTVTVTSNSHGLTTNDVIYVVNADSTGVPDGSYTVTVTNANVFTFQSNNGSVGSTLQWGTYKTPSLDFAIPSGVTSEYFYRVYRSDVSAAVDVEADESTLQLVDEQNLTSAQISTGFVIYQDETPDILRQQFLYTNPNTGEPRGILAANEKPPKCKDIANFKNHVFFSNVETFYTLNLALLSSSATTMPDNCEFTITSGMTTRTYIGNLDPNVGNRTVRADSVSFLLAVVTVTYANHGLTSGDVISVAQALDSSGDQLSSLPQGNYTITVTGANAFTFTAPGTPTGLTALSFAGISTSAGKRIFYIEDSANTSVGAAIDNTARAIVRAINRDASSPCYAYYTSTNDGVPGMMVFRSRSLTATFTVNAVTATIVDNFNPQIPTSGGTAVGTRDDGQGVLFFSKQNEPEAVPIVNQITVGSKASAILRIAPLRDSLIILKEDGCFRLNGDNYSNFVVTILDSTISMKASDSLAVLDNNVYCLADQGVMAISETTGQIVSRAIEPLLTSIAGSSNLEQLTHAVGYESERLYILSTITAADTDEVSAVYVYNHLTNAWSTWNSQLFLDAIVKPSDDRLYDIDFDNTIFRERKNYNRLDFCGLSYSGTATSVDDDTAVINFGSEYGAVNDVVVFNEIINRIIAVDGIGPTAVYTFAFNASFNPGDAVVLYRKITSIIRTSPYYSGTISLLKQFSELQGSTRAAADFTACDIYFISDASYSEIVSWESVLQSGGWGEESEGWGGFPWGDDDGINLSFDTQPAQPIRTYVPLESQRSTYIQADITHSVAAQAIMLQNLAFTSRIYKQRTTK